ncbi:helix-turn-helix domain-containing protein [Streptomyces tsukubensis]|uniref:Transcriptional regulator n=1 Tax=Streptomyces tsukubensis TaxID=83656 RepID=A0A1V4ADV0_9ACTN|nr:helix-turn-helix transcriptional regulator [Streptomyces tsukubensis]OON82212.1 transcriptional regulator [Streptomyces tsukubensis]QFR92699.1 helix-turn-helix domain-containing protein [Streptomyces tsukubensis]
MGERIAHLRHRRGLTQEQLAERAGVSVDVVRKLEQGRRRSARLATVNALARALDSEPSYLIGQPATFETRAEPEENAPSVLALRQAISPVADLLGGEDDPEDPPGIEQLKASLRSTEEIRRNGRMGEIGILLPPLIRDARAVVHATTGSERAAANSVLAVAYQVASVTLTGLGKEDAAFTAMERSMLAIRSCDDPGLETMAASTLSYVLTKQGRLADAERVALVRAEQIEPGFRSTPRELALWGILLLRAATASVRQEKHGAVLDLLRLAKGAAESMGRDLLLYATPFGPTNAGIATVNFLVEMERADDAVRAARSVPDLASLPPTWRARFHVDRALAYSDLDKDRASVGALMLAERDAPEWMRYHATSRRLVEDLRSRAGRRDAPVHDLADRLGLLR